MTNATGPATVLVVEDEQSLADLYAQFLESTYTVHTAYDGTAALEIMNSEVDVVLLDRRMPGLSGEEVLRDIRQEGYDCRVAMVTAVSPDVDIVGMRFDDYLTKPVDMTELIETVERLLALDAYDDLAREYYRLASKKAALEAETTDTVLAEDEGFNRLVDRLNDLESELRAKQGAGSEFDVRNLLNEPDE